MEQWTTCGPCISDPSPLSEVLGLCEKIILIKWKAHTATDTNVLYGNIRTIIVFT